MERTYAEVSKNAEHYRAIGMTEVYLDKKGEDFPWHLVDEVEPCGSHRLEIYTSVWMKTEKENGISYRWSVDIEPFTANGQNKYMIDVEGCKEVLAKLPSKAKQAFKDYLLLCADSLAKKGQEWKDCADKQFEDARTLRIVAGESSKGDDLAKSQNCFATAPVN